MALECRGLVDLFGGVTDLQDRHVLRPTSDAFDEDPLRILRGMQFAGRFGLTPAPAFDAAGKRMREHAASLPIERVWEEWRKWATLSRQPSAGLRALHSSTWLQLYPELAQLVGCPQDPEWHPEGDVWAHTGYVCDAAAAIAVRDQLNGTDRLILMLAALCHDLGKPDSTVTEDGRIRSPGHAQIGVPLTERLLTRIGARQGIIASALPLVAEHLSHLSLPLTPRTVNRLARRLEPASIEQWARVVEADHSGRPRLPPSDPAGPVVEYARTLQVNRGGPAPLLMGRHLIELGMKPGPAMGTLLAAAYERQLDGDLTTIDDAIAWAREMVG